MNGVQPNSNATRIDGAVSVNIWLPHHVGYVAPAEAIDTVTVSSNNFDADQGMAGGAATTLVTKSGTNTLRGSAFVFHNSEGLNANTFFNDAFGLPKPDLKKNIYGATLGGPIVKNKLFFFGSWERYARDNKYNDTYGVPTAKMRAGDFSEVASAYSKFQLYDPRTGNPDGSGRSPFPNFTIPASLISPISKGVMQYYPAPQHEPGPERQRARGRLRHHAQPVPAPRQLRRQAHVPAHARALDLGQVRDARQRGHRSTTSSSDSTNPRSATPRSTSGRSATPGRSARPSCSTATSASSR